MDIVDRISYIFVSLFLAGLGCLIIRYPHFMDGGYPTHTSGRGGFISLFVLIIFITAIKLMWNVIGGSILILFSMLGIIGIVVSFFPDEEPKKPLLNKSLKQPIKATKTEDNLPRSLLSQVGQLGKNHVQKKLIEKENNLSQPILSNSIKLGRKHIKKKLNKHQ